MLMKKAMLILLAFLLIGTAASADVLIKLRDGAEVWAEYVDYGHGVVKLPDGRTFDRALVKELKYFKGEKGWRFDTTAPDVGQYAAYLEKGRELAAIYPGHQVYMVEDDNVFTLTPENTFIMTTRSIYYINKEDGKRHANASWRIEDQRERLVFHALRSISGDLKIQNVDPKTIKADKSNESTRFFTRGDTVSARIPGAKVGGLVETYVTTETFNPYDPKIWFATNYFQSTYPVARSSVAVIVPEGTKINWYTQNMMPDKKEPTVQTNDGMTRYSWATGQMPPIIPEVKMPPDEYPIVVVSPFFDGEYLFDFREKVVGDKIVPDSTVKEAALELTEGAADDEEKVARIYHFVQKNIRYISIKGSIGSGRGGHQAWITLKNRYGDCVDKAILMTAMLDAVGIKSQVAFLMTNRGNQLMDKIPVLYSNHAITKVTLPERSFYLDSTATSYRYPAFRSDDHGSIAMLYKERKFERITPPPPSMNKNRWDYTGKIDKTGGIKLKRITTATGAAEARLRAKLTGVEENARHESLSNVGKSMSEGGRLLSFKDSNVNDLAKPIITEAEWYLPGYAKQTGDYFYFTLPQAGITFSAISLPERKYDVFARWAYSMEKNYELLLPRGYTAKDLPQPMSLNSKYFTISATYKIEGRKLVFNFLYEHQQGKVPVAEYDEYRHRLLEAERYCRQSIFLVRKGGEK